MANIYLKYPTAASPTHIVTITRNPSYPVPAAERIPQTLVTTMGGKTYASKKGPSAKRIFCHFPNMPDGDANADYLGILNFFKNVVEGARYSFDFVDHDGAITTVRLLNDPQSGEWQKTSHNRNSITLEMEEVI